MLTLKDLILLFFCSVLFLACATQGKLTGGDPDEDPPLMDSLKSTPNFQTNFSPTQFELHFDEFIEVKNTTKEVGISPPLNGIPKITSRGKKLVFEFPENEVLKEDVTYSVNFGDAIKDYHEGNVLKNFKFVFATGDKIDSLSISGNVSDAFTQEPLENVLIMLYDNLSDTAVYSERPLYYAKSEAGGKFEISNIKQDTFSIYAIQDENLNYTWDQDSESIGFIDSSFLLTDSSALSFNLELSLPSQEPEIITHEVGPDGKIKISFTQNLKEKSEFTFSKEADYHSSMFKDSLFIWYDTIGIKSMDMFILNDTLSIKPKKKKSKRTYSLELDKAKSTAQIIPNDSLILAFDYPIIRIDKERISIKDTSEVAVDFIIKQEKDLNKTRIKISEVKTNIPYTISLRDSSLASYNQVYNDSLGFNFTFLEAENLGTLNLSFDSIELKTDYVLQLMDKEKIVETVVFTEGNKKHIFKNLFPKAYSILLIEDLNGNKEWDAGNFVDKTQAEKIYRKELDKIKENWELELDLSNMITPNLEEQ